METGALKSFAMWARTALIGEVSARIGVVLAPGSPERVEQSRAVAALEKAVSAAGGGDAGRAAVVDKVAYTWFNRIVALRFMDANGYTGIGVVSPGRDVRSGQPVVLAEAKRGNIDNTVVTSNAAAETVTSLLNGTRRSDDPQGEAYALLLAAYCRFWNRSMPFMFEHEGDYTELLIPASLLADDSVLARSVAVLTEEVCEDVEVIGWLYQFYISERKDEVFAGFKKNKKAGAAEIPAATQLFTPHWIVRYLVENSLGRLWLLNRPSSSLAGQMDYYIVPVDEETDFLKVSSPEELKIMDPACGSGHMLTYAFDLLYAIYEEEGYAPSIIPSLILTNNLYGTEIDPRAGALAAFALTMKARSRQRTFFNQRVEPNICVLEPISFAPDELDTLATSGGDRADEEAFWNQFEHADVFGSLIRPQEDLIQLLERHLDTNLADDGDLLGSDLHERARRVVLQAEYLSSRYHVVVANPPYMGLKNMDSNLAEFLKLSFPRSKADLFAPFVERSLALGVPEACVGMITMHTWMFLSSFKKLRNHLLDTAHIATMAHLGTRAFDSIGGAVVSTTAFTLSNRSTASSGTFLRLVDGVDERHKQEILSDALNGRCDGVRFDRTSTWFRSIPGSPISYWLEDGLVNVFETNRALADVATPRQGLATTDNGRFLRRWYEVGIAQIGFGMSSILDARESRLRWFPYNKGGTTRRWYGNHEFVVNWEDDGREIKDNIVRKYPYLNGDPGFVAKNTDFYFRASISWSLIGTGAPSFRYYPAGFVFDVAGTSVFPNRQEELNVLLGYLNSSITEAVLAAIAPTMNLVGGDMARVPVPSLSDGAGDVSASVSQLVQISQAAWDSSELSWDFEWPPLLAEAGPLRARAGGLFSRGRTERQRVDELEAGLDQRFSEEVGLPSAPPSSRSSSGTTSDAASGNGSFEAQMADLVSYAVGCMLGRYSLDVPGLVLADQGDTLQDYLTKVPEPSFLPDVDNVIPVVDGDWFEDDIVVRFRQFLRVAFGEEHFEENLRFVTESLGVKDLRGYFVKSFYKDHVQRYKKRPIYWLFSSPKGSFNALIYMHRYTPSTVSTVLNEYLREFKAKLEASRQHHERLATGDGTAREKAAAQKEVDRLRKVILELDEYEHDVLYPLATQQVQIDLDDGVKANYPKFGAALKKIPGLEVRND